MIGQNSESNYKKGAVERCSREKLLWKSYTFSNTYLLETWYRNKDKITVKYQKGVILKTSKLRNDF